MEFGPESQSSNPAKKFGDGDTKVDVHPNFPKFLVITCFCAYDIDIML